MTEALYYILNTVWERNLSHNNDSRYVSPITDRLIKSFVKAMDQNSAGFMHLKTKFPRISDAKIKEVVFVGPQIRDLIQHVKFEDQLREVEKATRKSFKNVTTNFFCKS
jgi:hypothetical protein